MMNLSTALREPRRLWRIRNIDRHQKGGEGIEVFRLGVVLTATNEGFQGIINKSAFSVAGMRREEKER
jgi:hypothetical protein